MMDHLTRQDIDDLIERPEPPCVSIYLSMEPRGPETRQNPIALKSALGEAHRTLLENGMRRPDADALLAPAEALLGDGRYWQHQEPGLALFADGSGTRARRLPVSFERLVTVGERFQISPLIPILSADGEFYILALSQNEVRLLHGSRWHISQLELPDVPASLEEALWYQEQVRSLQSHATSAGARTLAFHGHGLGGESSDDDLRAFFRQVDEGIAGLVPASAPVVLAGVGYLGPIYREVSDLAIVAQAVEGNPEELSAAELHDRAWPLVARIFEERRVSGRKRFEAAPAGTTAWTAEEAVVAAADGRVDALFLPSGRHCWGSFDPGTRQVDVDGDEGSADLYDLAAAHTWRNGGDVFVVDPADVPGPGDVAAVLRY